MPPRRTVAPDVFGGHQAEIGHQLPRIGEASKVSDLGHDGDCNYQGDTAHGLECRNDPGPSTSSAAAPRFAGLAGRPGLRRPGRRERNPAARSAAPDGQSVPWSASGDSQRPGTSSSIDPIVAQQEALQMLACLGQDPVRRRPCSHQVAHGFMGGIGDPNRRQLARAVQWSVSPVARIGLHPVARLDWDQRRSHHNAIMPTAGQQPVQPITTRAGLVAKAQPTTPFAQRASSFIRSSGRFSKTLIWRTSPSRPLSANAMQTVALCTSNPT